MPQSFGELRINQDINMLNLRDNLGWKPIEVSTFMGILGASVTTGGKTVKPSLKRKCSSPLCVFLRLSGLRSEDVAQCWACAATRPCRTS